MNSLKEDKAKLEIQKEGEKREQDEKKKFFGFAIILDERVSNLIYEGNISSKFHITNNLPEVARSIAR